ncbi:tumor necrosis factor receptor superfamily member 14-like [Salminus brasiliensis]|uniref:tumor necrosis factor receptor superfamily member 14-like n=1 Tax=Salminus brasiliensis TaxID=930266 RepID=UPI003B8393B9
MACSLKIFVIAAVFSLSFELCFGKCDRSKYETDEGCCSKCKAGNRVHKHCSENTPTSCTPCPESTYASEPNGLKQCTICTACDPGQGLKVRSACTQSSDAVCEPRDGYYCTNQNGDKCTQAVEHKKCRPGQYIKHGGNAFKDTECDECTNGTYSDGSFQMCKGHSKCEGLGRSEVRPGSRSSDTECVTKLSAGVIAGITISVLLVVAIVVGAIVAIIICLIKRHKTVQPPAYTPKDDPEQCKTEKGDLWGIVQVFQKLSITKVYVDDALPSIQKS